MSLPRWHRPLLGLGLIFPTLMAWLYFVALAAPGSGQSAVVRLAYSMAKLIQFSLPLVCLLHPAFRGSRPLWYRGGWSGIGSGVIFGLLIGAAVLALYYGFVQHSSLSAILSERIRAKLDQFGMGTPGGFLCLAAFLAVVHSLLEEYYWRWFIFGGLKRWLPLSPALVVSSLGFMSHHVIVLGVFLPGQFFSVALPLSLGIALGGAAWALLYHLSGSLLGPWLSHLLIDAALMAVGYDLLFGTAVGSS